jgi:hypothetical protein
MQAEVDRAKAEAFAGRLLAALNDGALCLMVSVGHPHGPLRRHEPVTAGDVGRAREEGESSGTLGRSRPTAWRMTFRTIGMW